MNRLLYTTGRSVTEFRVLSKCVNFNTNRFKSSIYNIARAPPRKKESNQFIKWLLAVIPVSSFGLGVWQTYRLQWKLALIDQLQEKTDAEPVELFEVLSNLETMEYKPVKVRGKFLHEKEIFIGPRSLIEKANAGRATLMSDSKKNQGALVITPFQLTTGETILVNRGWIPQRMKPRKERTPSLIDHEVEIVGLVRLQQNRDPFMPKNQPARGFWHYRDINALSEYMSTLPVWLDVRGDSDPPPGWPVPNQTRITLRNEHMSYLITWYAMSLVTALLWHRLFVKKLPLM